MTYILQSASQAPTEATRLDQLHLALTEYCGIPLFRAELPGFAPRAILEMGTGTGAWAIEAAERYPEAAVTAIDISPMPERPLPSNLSFQLADVTQHLPFAKESFDLVHVRLLLMHVPNASDVLRRALELVRPGGWIIVEDPDLSQFMDETIQAAPPAAARFMDAMHATMRARDIDYSIGAKLEGMLRAHAELEEVNTSKAVMPMSGQSSDPALNRLGETWLAGAIAASRATLSSAFRGSMAPEVVEDWLAVLQEPGHKWAAPFYFTWSRKRAE